jgi:hypothetical protein
MLSLFLTLSLSISTFTGYAPLKVELRARGVTGYTCIQLWEEGLEGPSHQGCGDLTEEAPLLYRKFELGEGRYLPIVTNGGQIVFRGQVITVLEPNPSN